MHLETKASFKMHRATGVPNSSGGRWHWLCDGYLVPLSYALGAARLCALTVLTLDSGSAP